MPRLSGKAETPAVLSKVLSQDTHADGGINAAELCG